MKEAVNSNYFDVCKDMRYGINDFMNKHDTFIKNNKRGYGYWIWKHKIILEEYRNLNDNDILIYSDSGNTIFKNYLKMIEYLNILINGTGMLFFSIPYSSLLFFTIHYYSKLFFTILFFS